MYFNLRVNKIVFNHGIKLKKDKLTVQGTDCVIDLNDRSITITKKCQGDNYMKKIYTFTLIITFRICE